MIGSLPSTALSAGLGTLAVLVLLLLWLQRRFAVVRQIGVPLYVAAFGSALGVFGGLASAVRPGAADAVIFAFVLVSVAGLHVLTIYLFDGVIRGAGGVRLPPLIPRVVTALLYLVGFVVALRQVYEDLSLGPLLATSAVTSLVLGLALQPILGNFFAGLVIGFERPFRLNDWVEIGGRQARVVDITWRATHLRTRDNDNLIIPNARIAEQEITNYYYPHTLHLERVRVGVHYRTPPYRVTEALLRAARQVDLVLDRPAPDVYVREFGDSAIEYELRVWIDDIADQPRVGSECRRRIWEVFGAEGIVIPFPIRTLEIEETSNRLRVSSGEERRAPLRRRGWLFVEDGPGRGLSVALDEEPVTVGRGGECDLVLPDPLISKQQLRIERVGDRFQLVDLEGRQGTRVAGQAVERHSLSAFERIEIGDSRLVFELVTEREGPAPTVGVVYDAEPVAPPPAGGAGHDAEDANE
ncbi:MAG: FHA domain-containing protein [Acidobacteria bacterium]|nr:MAG: FHA domain-containing protein [Acidobacteriota bacterium]